MPDTKVMQCGHCGKQAVFITRGNGTQNGAKVGDTDTETQELTIWQIMECSNCNKPILEEVIAVYHLVETILTDSSTKATMAFEWQPTTGSRIVLYPGVKTPLTNLPVAIEKEYKDTLKVREISLVACAVLARRTLEAILTYENAEGKTLMEKINNLIKFERIPPLLADMAHLGRKIGNVAAHFAEEKVTEEDVTAMLDFVETILEYLYVAPAKVAAVRTRLTNAP